MLHGMGRHLIWPLAMALLVQGTSVSLQGQGRGGGPGGFGGPTGERVEPEDLEFERGVASIPDRETFEKLSYQGPDVARDGYLAELEYVKFIIERPGSDQTKLYWMNTQNYRAHPPYMREVGIDMRVSVRGAVTYLPRLAAPDGSAGLYIFDFQPRDSYSFEEIKVYRDDLVAGMPLLKGKIAFHPLSGNVGRYRQEKALYDASDVSVHLDEDLFRNIVYLPLNEAESFGRLRLMEEGVLPQPNEIVICRSLPNQLPRVAGVITEVRQTPLSHVNLRAVQDKVPNAYVAGASEDAQVRSLLGKLVHYRVHSQGYSLREATKEEVDWYFQDRRPTETQKPKRNLAVKKILPLKEIRFGNADSFGVKTANLAEMHQFELTAGVLPDGYGIPFYFYVQFMESNGLNKAVDQLLQESAGGADSETIRDQLKSLRSQIRQGTAPSWMSEALGQVQQSFDEGVTIRCRSSTNNEDLPGFSGAGLYDSYSHRPQEGHLSKTVQQVFASLWNYRAFEEREFYRIDHRLAAMGVLLHPSYRGEQANGVAVTADVLEYQVTGGNYYLNTQVGEDMVTNPDELSFPEETLLGWEQGHQVVSYSNRVEAEKTLLNESQLEELRKSLTRIHFFFARLYERDYEDPQFAMEIEFKVTAKGNLAIKQARPWVL